MLAIEAVDQQRDKDLHAQERIGKVIEVASKHNYITFLSNKRTAPFEWQRLENKLLGRGSFGSVYLVMNLRDNCLMAMKQIHVPRENNAALKALAEEVENVSEFWEEELSSLNFSYVSSIIPILSSITESKFIRMKS
jgi:hypothetical protein